MSFTGSNVKTFDIYNAENIQIKNCNILFSGTDGIYVKETTNLLNSSITSCPKR
ncbi:MAG: hypothetical protein ACR2KX_20410 [Chitinophagaceae bacterium]